VKYTEVYFFLLHIGMNYGSKYSEFGRHVYHWVWRAIEDCFPINV